LKRPDEKLKVIDEIAGKPTRETERILDDLRTQEKPKRKPIFLKQETIDLIKEVYDLKAHKFADIDEVIVEMVKLAKNEWDRGIVKRRSSVTESKTRYVPAQVRAAVWERDQGKCKNCGSKRALEFDHIKAFALGGKTSVDNLRLLCRNCNQRRGLITFPAQGKMRSSLK
jgi:5-methylcytosine-specific restriction endonuclease McrA